MALDVCLVHARVVAEVALKAGGPGIHLAADLHVTFEQGPQLEAG